jgi:hypothetical protein
LVRPENEPKEAGDFGLHGSVSADIKMQNSPSQSSVGGKFPHRSEVDKSIMFDEIKTATFPNLKAAEDGYASEERRSRLAGSSIQIWSR